ncbi:hypothetical protein [Thalassotalea sediminis]|uniref:hypothetical protein n=1 Tax=Thalassotalea sediminis TaxID=1759089 RepID=UPI0025732A0C|nr:hypothetical protein [Thalassotalea sediminis]
MELLDTDERWDAHLLERYDGLTILLLVSAEQGDEGVVRGKQSMKVIYDETQ